MNCDKFAFLFIFGRYIEKNFVATDCEGILDRDPVFRIRVSGLWSGNEPSENQIRTYLNPGYRLFPNSETLSMILLHNKVIKYSYIYGYGYVFYDMSLVSTD